MNVELLEQSLYKVNTLTLGSRNELLGKSVAARGQGLICEFGVGGATTLNRRKA